MKRRRFFPALLIGVGLLLFANPESIFAQGETGSVTGIVSDPQGGVVAGADVTLTDITTQTARTTTTNDAGRYHFASVHVGSYDVMISRTGFKTYKASAQRVSVGTQLTLDVTLEVGALTETVVVSSQAGSELQTANATVGTTISLKDLELLPNLGRDASTLMALQPAISPGGQVAGAVGDQNTFTIDGGQNTDDMSGDTVGYIVNFTGTSGTQTNGMASGVVPTPVESVEEFRINTVGQTADFNGSIGAQVQMVTRRGSSRFHGSAYGFYFTPNILGAQTWALNHTPFTKGFAPDRRPCAAGTTYHKGDNNCVMPSTPLIPNHRSRYGFSASGPMLPKMLGGKTFFFVLYEGFRYPNSDTFEKPMPSEAFRKGVIQIPDATGNWIPYNLNPFPVTVTVGNPLFTGANALRVVTLPGTTLDPRAIGMNSTIGQVWNTMPLPNDPTNSITSADQFNTQGYLAQIKRPLTSDVYVGRVDHDFGSNHHFFSSFRAQHLLNLTSNQVDVGGLLGGTKGQYNPTGPRPQTPELLVIGLTSNLSPTITNDLRLSYLYNWWEWGTKGAPPQVAGLRGALEIAPAQATTISTNAENANALIPFNINNQSTRQRVWSGHDYTLRDDVSWVKGNHLFQFGGLYQRNFDYHNRTDNGLSINNQIVYQIAANQIDFTGFFPGFTGTTAQITAQRNRYRNLATSVFGLVGLTQLMYTRAGSDLHLLPIGARGIQESTIKTYNVYASDTWKIKPTITVSYGLGWTYETPPVEKNGNQVVVVDANSNLIHTADYLRRRQEAALAGQVYNPVLGFQTTRSLNIKYPYTPFKKGFSPRISVAWSPSFKSGFFGKLLGDGQTVFRAGYGRLYGRINGVNQVLVPLLGPGILQAVSCGLAVRQSTNCGFDSGGNRVTTVTPNNVFRIGTDGLEAPLPIASPTLPQPFLPGIGGNVRTGDASMLDPDYRPEITDNFNFTIQHEFSPKFSIEVGYIGRRIRNELQQINLDAIPHMTTLGGQKFSDAYAKLYQQLNSGVAPSAVTVQPFFEASLAKAGGTFCNGFPSCTVAVASNTTLRTALLATAAAQFWNGLAATNSWILPPALLSNGQLSGGLDMDTSLGYGNYNALFASLRMRDWHGISAISSVTWGRALGTTSIPQRSSSRTVTDPWNLDNQYGPQQFDFPLLFKAGFTYQPTSVFGIYDLKTKHGIVGQLLNGWAISPFFSAQSGTPLRVLYTQGNCTACQAFGAVGAPGIASIASDAEQAVLAVRFTGGHSLNGGVTGSNGIGTVNPSGLNMFADPAAIYAEFRPCVLGLDTRCGGAGNIRGFPRWNMDAALSKEFRFKEHFRVTFSLQVVNVLNHFQPSDPSLNLTTAQTFGVVNDQVYGPRQTEFGLRIGW